MITFDEFITKWLGKKADFDGKYDGQCVDLYRFYVQEVLDYPQPMGVSGAKNFWSNYESDPNLKNYYDKIPNTPTGVPLKGDVILWNEKAGGGYGHVAIFIEGNTKKFTSFDQNWPTLSKCTKTEHDYTNIYGWFRPKKTSTNTDALTECLNQHRQLVDQIEKELKPHIKDLEDEIEQLNGAKKTYEEWQKTLSEKLKCENQLPVITGEIDKLIKKEDDLIKLEKEHKELHEEHEEKYVEEITTTTPIDPPSTESFLESLWRLIWRK